ncbi:hypothetical protein BG011_003243, partial [Mortierella polycephala]
KELPFLRKEILELIGESEREIASMGPPVSSAATAKIKYFECILKLKSLLTDLLDGNYSFDYISKYKADFENKARVDLTSEGDNSDSDNDSGVGDDRDDDFAPLPLDGDHRFIRASLHGLYQNYNQAMNRDKFMLPKEKISELVLRYKGSELPGFVSFTAFKHIYIETLVPWSDLTKVHINNMHRYLYKVVTNFIESTAEPLLKDMLLLEFDKFYNSQSAKIDDVIKDIFTDEGTPFTMN